MLRKNKIIISSLSVIAAGTIIAVPTTIALSSQHESSVLPVSPQLMTKED